MDTLAFLNTILPDQGVFCASHFITTRDGERKFANKPFLSKAEMARWIEDTSRREDVWTALASFKELDGRRVRRTHANLHSVRALWADLDVGPNDPNKYASQREAAQVFSEWCRANNLPPAMLVSSGYGIHVYWPLDTTLSREQWEPLNNALKEWMRKDGIKCDASAFEAARVLRPTGTFNHKRTPPKPVKLVRAVPAVALSAMTDLLRPYIVESKPAVSSGASSGWDVRTVVRECAQIRACGSAIEPVWRGALSVLRLCKGGRKAAHILSATDPRYNEADLDAKLDVLDQQHADNAKPMTCQTFDMLRPGICQSCPKWGKVLRGELKSPVTLGGRPPVAPIQTTFSGAIPTNLAGMALPALPFLENGTQTTPPAPAEPTPAPGSQWLAPVVREELPNNGTFDVGSNRYQCITPAIAADPELVGVVWISKTQNDDGGWDEERIYLSDSAVYPIHCTTSIDNGERVHSTVWRIHQRGKDGYEDAVIPNGVLHGTTFMTKLAQFGITVKESKLFPKMGEYMREYLATARATMEFVEQATHVGWVAPEVFSLGSHIYSAPAPGNVTIQPAIHNSELTATASSLVPEGSYDAWRAAYDVFAKPGQEHFAFASFVAWGAPLMKFTAYDGLTVSLYSPIGGEGKSTLQRITAAAWGNPQVIMPKMVGSKEGTTYNAFMSLVKQLHSLPVIIDELSRIDDESVAGMLHSISLGEERRRADQRGNIRATTGTWSTICLVSTNKSLREQLANAEGREHDPLLKRLLEIKLPATRPATWQEDRKVVDRIKRTNYGFAGEIYAKYLVANAHLLEEIVSRKIDDLIDRANGEQSERFWFAGAACMLVGAELAKAAGLHEIDTARIEDWFINDLLPDQRRTSAETRLDASAALAQYLADNVRSTLTVRRRASPATLQETGAYVINRPSNGAPLSIRAEMEERRAFIAIAPLREWCRRHHVSYESVLLRLSEEGTLIQANTRTALGKGVQEMVTTQGTTVACIEVAIPLELIPIGPTSGGKDVGG